MATIRTTHLQHELSEQPHITFFPDGTTQIQGLFSSIPVYATEQDRDAAFSDPDGPAPFDGQVAFIVSSALLTFFMDGQWLAYLPGSGSSDGGSGGGSTDGSSGDGGSGDGSSGTVTLSRPRRSSDFFLMGA